MASLLLWRKLSAFRRLAETQIDSIGKKCWTKDSDGLASLLLDTRRLICILGAGQNADGVSRGAVLSFAGIRSGMQSLVAISLRTPD